MKIEYTNMPQDVGKLNFTLRYIMNNIPSWFYFNIRYPWVKYKGFVRVMPHCHIIKRDIVFGNNVQLGRGTWIITDFILGTIFLWQARLVLSVVMTILMIKHVNIYGTHNVGGQILY